jgi:hypothetical protein
VFNLNIVRQFSLRVIQYSGILIFPNILTQSEIGIYTKMVAVSGVVVATGSLGNNVFNKNQSVKSSDKLNRLNVSLWLTFICGIVFSLIAGITWFNLGVLIFSLSELARLQLSTIYLAQRNEEKGTIIEVYPLIIGTILAIIFTLIIQSIWTRIYFFSFSSLIISFWLARKLIANHLLNFGFTKYRWKMEDLYPFIITILISVLFLFEKLTVGRHGDVMLGIYGLNLSIMSSSMFYSKWIENLYISRGCNINKSLYFHVFTFVLLVLIFSQILPQLLPVISLMEYVITKKNMFVLAFVPINTLLIGLKLNLLYVKGDLYRIICVVLAVSLSASLVIDWLYNLYWHRGILTLYFLVDMSLFTLVFFKKEEHRYFFLTFFLVNSLIYLLLI